MSNVLREIGERLKNRKGVLFLVQRKPPAAVGGFYCSANETLPKGEAINRKYLGKKLPTYCIMLPIEGRRPCRPWGQQTNIVFVYFKVF